MNTPFINQILEEELSKYIKQTMNIILKDSNAKIPTKGSDDAAGYDLYSVEEGIIEPYSHKLIDTGITLEIPKGYYGKIAPRSGLAYKNGIDIFAGIIDSDYRGIIKCILYNSSANKFNYHINDRIAQIIFHKYENYTFNVIENSNETKRNDKGFGSTG